MKPGAQAQTEGPQTGAGQREQNPMGGGEREQPSMGAGEQPGKPGMKGETAETQQPENRMQPGNMPQRQSGSQAGERREQPQRERGAQGQERTGQAEKGSRSEQPGTGAEQNGTGQAQMGETPNRQGQAGGQMGQANRQGQAGEEMAGRNVQATGKTNIPHDKAEQVAHTLMSSRRVQTSPNINVNEVRVGADMPADVVINPLPPAIPEIVPEFRGYDYFVVGDEVVIVDPASRQVVEIIEGVG
jgi:Protein of unknown function (DUF1236)